MAIAMAAVAAHTASFGPAPDYHASTKRKRTPPSCVREEATGKLCRLVQQESDVPRGVCSGCGIVRGQCVENWDGRRMCRFCFSRARVAKVYSYSNAALKEAVQRESLQRRGRQLLQDAYAMLQLPVPRGFRCTGKRLALRAEVGETEEPMAMVGALFPTLRAIDEAGDDSLISLRKAIMNFLGKYVGF